MVSHKETFSMAEEEVKIIHTEGDKTSGVEMTPTTVTGIIGIEILKVKVILIGAEDGTINNRGQGHSDWGRGRRWNPNPQYHDPGVPTSDQIRESESLSPTTDGTAISLPNSTSKISIFPTTTAIPPPQMTPAPSHQATNICQLCQNQGHYDYQCQFAGDFMARTQKAFNQGRSYNHQDPAQEEWSNGDNDNNDPNGQPFQ